MATLEFWFDFASTYSYPAAMRIEALAEQQGVSVVWMPFLLGPAFAKNGWDTSPFNIYPAKGAYMWRDMARICAAEGLAFKRPAVFPQFTLTAARIGLAAADEPWLGAYCRAVFLEEYGRGGDVTSPEVLARLMPDDAGDPHVWLARAAHPDIKQGLKDRTAAAMDKQLFGAPSLVTGDGELFWGNDRLEQAVAWAAGNRHSLA